MSNAEIWKLIERKNKELERLYEAGDIQEVGKVFTSDVWQMPPNSPPLVGRDALIDFWSGAVTWGSGRSGSTRRTSRSRSL